MKQSGVLCPIFSLPSPYGIGSFSKEAYDFVDFLQGAGQRVWQILPLGPTSVGDSPYQSFSTFAGNPYFVDLDTLIQEGLLTKEECKKALGTYGGEIDYKAQYEKRIPLLKKAYGRFTPTKEYQTFVKTHRHWLADYSLFMALKTHFHGAPFPMWEEPLRSRDPKALEEARKTLAKEIGFWEFVQYLFFTQWQGLKAYANQRNIKILGDLPIYVAPDSADVWANHHLFQLTKEGHPTFVAGCPPDGFSENGQLWGNPLYNWKAHKEENYEWWRSRITHALTLFDTVRLDHFRGFEAYYAIPFGEKTAKQGKWEQGPAEELFQALKDLLTPQNTVAEDLGFITQGVQTLLNSCGFPGMKVLQFAFDSRDKDQLGDLPHSYPQNCVAYTGTHDNQTLISWFATISHMEQQKVRTYLGDFYTPPSQMHKPLIARLLATNANLCIIPLQDYLGLDDTARINTPATLGNNWKWRFEKGALTPQLQKEMNALTKLYNRV